MVSINFGNVLNIRVECDRIVTACCNPRSFASGLHAKLFIVHQLC